MVLVDRKCQSRKSNLVRMNSSVMFKNTYLEKEWIGRHGGRGGYADAVVSAAVLVDLDGTLIDHRRRWSPCGPPWSTRALKIMLSSRTLSFDGSHSNDRTWMSFSPANARSLSNGVAGFVRSYQSWVSPLLATVNLTRG